MISTVETTILATVNAAVPFLKETGSLGGNWTLDALKRAIQMSPGVYVSFLGGPSTDYKTGRVAAKFAVYTVNKGAVEVYRRKGTQNSTGAYALLSAIIPVLHQLQVPNVGVLKLEKLDNLFKETSFNLGASVYALIFSIDLYFEPVAVVEPLAAQLSFSDNTDTLVVP